MKQHPISLFLALAAASHLAGPLLQAQTSPYRGLWVGEVTLDAVNEVAVPLDENNVPKAPDPNVPTKTFDTANLRLILHVDASGHVSLLKNVAVLSRTGDFQATESDLVLVTDEYLYGEFPPQAAQRISSAVFDFGDSKATEAVQKMVDKASKAASDAVWAGQSEATAAAAAKVEANKIVAQADVAERYDNFLRDSANRAKVTDIADGAPADAAATMMTAAVALRDGSFYGDTRGVEMVNAIVQAVNAQTGVPAKISAALNTAASFADLSDNHERFLVGQIFGDMLKSAAATCAKASLASPVKSITNYEGTDGALPVKITSVAHGLATNEEVAVFGSPTAAYNGIRTVIRENDDQFRIQVPFVAGQPVASYAAHDKVAPLRITSPAHGLSTGAKVTIYGSGEATYNGEFLAARIDADTFSIPAAYVQNPAQKGVWSARSGEITGYEGTAGGTAGVKVFAPGHGLSNGAEIDITDSGQPSYNHAWTITRIDENSFSLPLTFAGNPAAKGSWSIRVPIVGYAPPAVLSTLVTSPAHGLTTGDRITISGSDKAAYNAQQQVEVIDANTFVIPVVWDVATGNPAVKGAWAPGLSGSWRRVAPLRTALTNDIKVNDAKTEALRIQVSAYNDSRSTDAVNVVLEAVIATAATSGIPIESAMATEALAAGRKAQATDVKRYAQPTSRPTNDYNTFVDSDAYQDSADIAANAAAAGAKFEKANNSLATTQSVLDKATQEAVRALNSVYAAAARAIRSSLPLTGGFGPGVTGLAGTIFLPANHPTNPFRHRRHPDHSTGFDITRLLTLGFDGADGDPLATAGYGVDRITGKYEEEITGLHKPLGPAQNVGLKVKGTFQLTRISLIDTLNGR